MVSFSISIPPPALHDYISTICQSPESSSKLSFQIEHR
jgi:hypothetical protein